MKRQLKKWMFRITVTAIFIAGLLAIIILNPILTYAHKTEHGNLTVFHKKTFDPALLIRLDEATALIKASELYNPTLRLDICLHDGSYYPKLIRALRGQAFAWGFYDKVVLQGKASFRENQLELHGYTWNLAQLLAHEMTHCMQFDKLGFWKSNPVAQIPKWKWEGYAEYVSRQQADQKNLATNIRRFLAADATTWEIRFADHTMAPMEYYAYWILMQYCMDIKKMTYREILADTANEQTIRQNMMHWFSTLPSD